MLYNFARSVLISLSLMIWPRNVTERCPNQHFDGFNFKFAFVRRFSENSRPLKCSLNVRPNIIMSSKKARQVLKRIPLKTIFIRRMKVAGAVASPNGMTVH